MKSRLILALLPVALAAGCNENASDSEDAGVDVSDDATVDAGADSDSDAILFEDIRIVSCDKEDTLAPNQDTSEATDASAGIELADLYVCSETEDWFRIDGSAGQTVSASISFANRIGDLDLYLLSADALDLESAIAESNGEEDIEALTTTLPADGLYYLVVDGFEDAVGVYDIEVATSCFVDADCPEGFACSFIEQACTEVLESVCGDDANEPNNTPTTATPVELAGDGFAFIHGYRVCEEDDDYYSLTLTETSTISAEMLFDQGFNIDMYFYSPEGALLGAANDELVNPEYFVWDYAPAGTYIIGIDHFVTQLGNDVTYNLTLEVTPGSCESNFDCTQGGRSLCEAGACVPFVVSPPSEAGGLCDDDGDCVGDLGCYEGGAGLDDNFCTAACGDDSDCGIFDGGQCIGNRNGICFAGCETDLDCPLLYACVDGGTCDLVECGVDSDCDDDQLCRRSEQQNLGLCTSAPFAGCREDDEYEANDTLSAAAPIDGNIEALICDSDDDWYEVEIAEDGTELNVAVTFAEGTDIDLYIFDLVGTTLGSGTEPEANPERASAQFLAAGTYAVRVNQFPSGRDQITDYSLSISTSESGCTVEGEECLAVTPLRIVCEEEIGACVQFEGEGTVELGGVCDSTDDCVEETEFCWSFEPASEGNNICTRRCS
ncbi:MAG: hypothetical protein ACJAYU_001287, partial [Bradymonadia bacterium]